MEKENSRTRTSSIAQKANQQSVKAWKKLKRCHDGTEKASMEEIAASYFICLLSEGLSEEASER